LARTQSLRNIHTGCIDRNNRQVAIGAYLRVGSGQPAELQQKAEGNSHKHLYFFQYNGMKLGFIDDLALPDRLKKGASAVADIICGSVLISIGLAPFKNTATLKSNSFLDFNSETGLASSRTW
jgi:hypothetical protein